jgi:carboxypeptidase C (cathepsin A)
MGALGPRRVFLKNDGFLPPAPYRLEDNPYTFLDKSDLVLVDAIGTGFSRAETSDVAKKFWGVKGDIDAFSEFIRMYISRYERWSSPLFLLGESYGTTRSAGIAGKLAEEGISFNGITLLSTVLNFQSLADTKTNDQPYISQIPSFTSTTAGYHHKLPPDLQQDMNKARQQASNGRQRICASSGQKGRCHVGGRAAEDHRTDGAFTGLSKDVIDQANLRIDVAKFTHLFADRSEGSGWPVGRALTRPDPDGVLTLVLRSDYLEYRAAVHLHSAIMCAPEWATRQTCRITFARNAGVEWEWGSGLKAFLTLLRALRHAIVRNPYLKVLVMEGYYDMATRY